ncbi:mannitol-1-phosphate dehydrogenase [Chaetomium globosum CBS 148.51]|uniref:Mannitol-1-phosphate 5-dehydrogenase n=1 Tax=Chaetomium globosum (strain ATCC 6205 / CBS 148.51 / DSM 1962 / NBRC 6347 / NRRL 1970) TaxID=306901 RepID=MTLD_CHAGB|nr:mannitol-1-phosphate dehydrogenase [Chaetomium globosum CBS 148.51]Q2H2D7.1 RecName: Full=Mannitol-1-phosphate 5-dehydrogenase; Short=M1PDH; Short=MPD; Short=MPDH [Chaetomium globosum CBS 148.51]EAQ87440.1 mannitol-1-phosphate dehydrogenase [Chaetomium globosum CBS 148.51]
MVQRNAPKKAVHFGAGNIGRGFVACFLHNSGYEVIFAEVNDTTVQKLNSQKSYKVIEVGADGTSESTITNYRAINSRLNEAELVQEIATADLVTCSVGPHILKFLAPVIAKGIDARSTDLTPVAVIACENAIGATDTLAEFIKAPENTNPDRLADYDKRARFANSAIDRIVPAQDPDAGLDVRLEKFYEWVVERTPFADHEPPAVEGIHWVDNLQPFIERKLYTVNTGHATAAYHGYIRRKSTVYDALQDREIQEEVKKALANTASLITQKHGIPQDEQQAYVDKIVRRISNPHLEDAVERVGRAPLRKLSRKERFIGPAAELAEHGKDCGALLDAAEMAFRFQNVEGDDESFKLAEIMEQNGPEDVVKQVCGLEPKEKLFPAVVDVVKRVQADTQSD